MSFSCLLSELVSALVRVLPQPAPEHPEHGGERAGPPRPGAAAAPGGPRRHLTGNNRRLVSSRTRQKKIVSLGNKKRER